jgi:hypothetical protein
MGSISKEIRQKQKDKAEALLAARIAILEKEGVDKKGQAKDTLYRKYRAQVKKGRLRLEAIVDQSARVEIAKVAKEAAIAKKAKDKAKKAAKGKKGDGKKGGGKKGDGKKGDGKKGGGKKGDGKKPDGKKPDAKKAQEPEKK